MNMFRELDAGNLILSESPYHIELFSCGAAKAVRTNFFYNLDS